MTRHRQQFLERGILYPSPRVNGLTLDFGNHNNVSDALTGVSRYPHMTADQYFDQFFADAQRHGAESIILSAEHFFGGEPRLWNVRDEFEYFSQYRQKVEALRNYLQHHDVSIIVYLRPQVDWFSSSIAQEITFGTLVQEVLSDDDDRTHFEKRKLVLRYSQRLDIWRDVLRPMELRVVPYVRERLYEKSSVTDFLKRCGIEFGFAKEIAAKSTVNKSLSREYLEVKRRLNRRPKGRTEERVVLRCLRNLSRESQLGSTYRVDPDVVRDIEEYVAEDNAKLSLQYLSDGERFVAKAAYRGDELAPLDEPTISMAMAAFEGVYRSPRMRLFRLRHKTLAFLRRYARPAHVLVHQIKRLRRRLT